MKKHLIPILLLTYGSVSVGGCVFAEDKPFKGCAVGLFEDWTGISKADEITQSHLHTEDSDPIWQGNPAPKFAKATSTGEVCQDHDNRGMRTRQYFIFSKENCPQKEEYVKNFYQFWRSQGVGIPKLYRLPDPTLGAPTLCRNPVPVREELKSFPID
jgi:hypothetical protein